MIFNVSVPLKTQFNGSYWSGMNGNTDWVGYKMDR